MRHSRAPHAPRARLLLAACLLSPLAAAAQDGGRHAAVVLALPSSPRGAALADAVGALAGDAAALFTSPAQLATLRAGAGASVERFLAGTTLASAVAATRMLGGTGAIGLRSLAYPDVEETRDFTATGGTVSGGELAVTAGWARPVAGVRVGASATLVRQRVAEASGQAVAADVGLAWTAPHGASPVARTLAGTTVAAALQNVGGELSLLERGRPLPRRVRVAVARPFALAPALRLLATGELAQLDGEAARPAAGAELQWQRGVVGLTARGGVRRRLVADEALPAHVVGAGVSLRALALDYAYQGYAALGATHRLGLRWAP